MKISAKKWKAYIDKLGKIDQRASDLMSKYMTAQPNADDASLAAYAYSLVTRYGEAASALACEMYDAMVTASGKTLARADPADVPQKSSVEVAVMGAKIGGDNAIPNAVLRIVRQAGQDTILKNARRDGAYFAWIASGDSCAFCRTLASNGWRRASKETIKGNHATHIHANCNCAFAIRFDPTDGVEDYDETVYEEEYETAEGGNSFAKMKYMRRQDYAKNKDEINRQKRAAYAKRMAKKTKNKPASL